MTSTNYEAHIFLHVCIYKHACVYKGFALKFNIYFDPLKLLFLEAMLAFDATMTSSLHSSFWLDPATDVFTSEDFPSVLMVQYNLNV